MASTLDLAARLPGEADLLAAVAANPNDDAAKLVYADWLEDHADERGRFLRRFVEAVQKSKALPKPGKDLTGWLEIIGAHLVAHIHLLGLREHRAAILARARPAVAVNTEPSAEDQ